MAQYKKSSNFTQDSSDINKIGTKKVPLNIVLFRIKMAIASIRPFIADSAQHQRMFVEAIDGFEDELSPYLDDLYFYEVEGEKKKLKLKLIDEGYEDGEIDDEDNRIIVEVAKVKYRLLNRILCRKNLYPLPTFVDTINPN